MEGKRGKKAGEKGGKKGGKRGERKRGERNREKYLLTLRLKYFNHFTSLLLIKLSFECF